MKPSHVSIAFFFSVLVIISYMLLIIFGNNGWRDLNAMKQELIALRIKNEQLQHQNKKMLRKIKRLKEDPEFIEAIARQELKMIGKDEIVFKFKNDDTQKGLMPAAKEGNEQ